MCHCCSSILSISAFGEEFKKNPKKRLTISGTSCWICTAVDFLRWLCTASGKWPEFAYGGFFRVYAPSRGNHNTQRLLDHLNLCNMKSYAVWGVISNTLSSLKRRLIYLFFLLSGTRVALWVQKRSEIFFPPPSVKHIFVIAWKKTNKQKTNGFMLRF